MNGEQAPAEADPGDAESGPSPVLNPDATRPQPPNSYSRSVVTDSMQLAGTNVATKEEVAAGVAIEGLSVKFRGTPLIDGISTLFEPNKVTAIVGPTGCGKTTLLRSINRMHDHVAGMQVSGSVVVEGVDIYGPDVNVREVRRRVGMLFQRPNPFPRSIVENVGLAPRAHGLADRGNVRELVRENLTMVGLWDAVSNRLHGSPFGLSGGQQQLLCLARTLALSPDVILLDEPTSALDPISTEMVEGLVRALTPALTLIVVTHNLAQARRISDITMFFYDGHLVEHGPTDDLFENPKQEQTGRYVSGRIG